MSWGDYHMAWAGDADLLGRMAVLRDAYANMPVILLIMTVIGSLRTSSRSQHYPAGAAAAALPEGIHSMTRDDPEGDL